MNRTARSDHQPTGPKVYRTVCCGIQSLLLFDRRLRLIVHPRREPHARLVDQFGNHLRYPKRERQQNYMRNQEAGFQSKRPFLRQGKRIDQERRVDLMLWSIPARSNVQAITDGPEDRSVNEVQREGDAA
jgi:hypothetical protein